MELAGLPELVELAGLLELVEPAGVHTYHHKPGRLRAGTRERAWTFDTLEEHMGNTLHSEHEESSRDLAFHDARARNKRPQVQL